MIYGTAPGAQPLPPWSARARRNVKWLERHAYIPDGPKAGERMRLTAHQRDQFRCLYQWDDRLPRHFICSEGRKNAKTAKASMIVQLHTIGPEARKFQQVVTTARVKDQAAVTYDYCANSIRSSPTLAPVVDLKDAQKEYTVIGLGTKYKALSKEAKTKLGSSPAVAIHDEVGAIEGPSDQLIDAIETGMKAHASPLSVWISTQAAKDGDLLSTLIDDALARPDDQDVVLFFSTAPKELEDGIPEPGKEPEQWAVPPNPLYPYTEAALRAANPEAGVLCNLSELLKDADKAQRLPSFDATYRNLTLNQRVEAEALFVPRALWNVRAKPGLSLPAYGVPVYLGLDLSSVGDLTALGAVWEDPLSPDAMEEWESRCALADKCAVPRPAAPSGVLNFWAKAWLPAHELAQRARADKVPYDVWARQGFLSTVPGKAIDYPFVAEYVKALWGQCSVKMAGFDRWGWDHFKTALKGAGMAPVTLEKYWLPVGMGTATMTPILREIETRLLAGTFWQPNNPVLTMAAGNVVARGPDNARAPIKKHAKARIDPFVAIAIAIGAWLHARQTPPTQVSMHIL